MKNLTIALVVVVAVLAGFYSGWKYSQSKAPSTPVAAVGAPPVVAATAGSGATAGGNGGNGAGTTGGFGGRGATVGQVTAVNGTVVTIHNPLSGQDVKVDISAGTVVNKTVAGSPADLQPGVNVSVAGQPNPDGSVNATTVSIVPTLPTGNGGRGRATPTPGT